MTAAKAFSRDRDAALRSLDGEQFDRFARKWGVPVPRAWVGDARLAAMHKARLQIEAFTEFDKAISRVWLAQHGYSEKVGEAGPCPACGGIAPSHSSCPVCGVA